MKKVGKILGVVLLALGILAGAVWFAARFIFLAPACYSDNKTLSERENYFIKKTVLEAVENQLSYWGEDTDPEEDRERKHIFIFIDKNFMDTVKKDNGAYIVRVQTYGMESVSDDCIYEIHISSGFHVTLFGLDP